jgi:hypothetical protein
LKTWPSELTPNRSGWISIGYQSKNIDPVTHVVSTDGHTAGEGDFMHLGVSQARRGWCAPDNIINTRPLDSFVSFFEDP